MSDLHGNKVADAFQLDGLSAFLWIEALYFRLTHEHAVIRAPLKHHQSVDMFAGVGAGCPFVRGFADHPADLPVTDGANRITAKIKIGRQDKVALYLLVYKMKF